LTYKVMSNLGHAEHRIFYIKYTYTIHETLHSTKLMC